MGAGWPSQVMSIPFHVPVIGSGVLHPPEPVSLPEVVPESDPEEFPELL
jgi:hypothetical protein